MKVLNCLHRSHVGGAQRRAVWVAGYLRRAGVETAFLFPRDSDNRFEDWLVDEGFEYKRVFMPVIRRKLLQNVVVLLTLPAVIFRLWKFIRRSRVDVVHVNGASNIQPLIAAILSRARVVWHWNDLLTPGWFIRLSAPLARYSRMRVVVATSAIPAHYGLDPSSYAVLHAPIGPVEVSLGARASVRNEIGVPENGFLIGFVSNIVPDKGVEDFLASLALLSDVHGRSFHAVIVGADVPSQAAYARRIRRLASTHAMARRIHFAGFRDNVVDWLSGMDMFVFPSHSEACPIVVLQALAMGLPTVATAVGEVPRMVEGLHVPVVDPGDVEGLALGMLGWLNRGNESLAEYALAAMQKMTRVYSLEAIARRHIAVYSDGEQTKGGEREYLAEEQ